MSLFTLDPELAEVLSAFPDGLDPGAHLADLNLVRALRSTPELLQALGGTLPTDDRVIVTDRLIAGPEGSGEIVVRIYEPKDRETGPGRSAGIVFLHGGAFVLGDVYTEELRCLRFAAESRCVVVSVGYRLAPENPFPAGVNDAYSALCWTASADDLSIDPNRLGVAGSSAGGALAAATALMARDRGGPDLVFQLLIYPVLDDRMDSPSMREFVSTPIWTSVATAEMWAYYLGSEHRGTEVSPYAAPARAVDLAGLPPAFILTAELDPLRDEGIEYARRLMQAGVSTELHSVRGACHGFDIFAPRIAMSELALSEQTHVLGKGLEPRSAVRPEGA